MCQEIKDKGKEEFNLLVQYITETNKSFIENTAKVAGFLLLALGWLSTASDARRFLSDNYNFAAFSAIAVAAVYLLSVWASRIAYKGSLRVLDRLKELSYLPPSAYQDRVLSQSAFIICVVGNGVLAIILIVGLLVV